MSLTAPRQAEILSQPSLPGIEETPSLGTRAVHGAFWNIFFSVLGKVVAFGGQIALAWFLLPADMGLAGIALAVTNVAFIVSSSIPIILLVQHEGAFEEKAAEVFWFSLTMTAGVGLLLFSASPLLRHLFHDPRVVPLMLIVAASTPLMCYMTVFVSRLSRDLCFRTIAQIRFGEGLIRNIGAVILAAVGLGPYALILPQPVGALYSAISYRVRTGRIPLGRPHPRRWLGLVMPVIWLVALALVNALQVNGTVFVIGLVKDATVTGFYSWGFALSAQAIFLLGTNLQGVFFPVLGKLNQDAARQREAFRRMCTLLCLAILPVCVLQIVLARPVIGLLFHSRWLPAAPVVQWLSVGMLTESFSVLGVSLLLAHGKYRPLAGAAALLTVLTTGAALVGAHFGGAAAIARCTGITLFFANLLPGWIACRQGMGGAKYFFGTVLRPVLLVVPLLGAGTLLAFFTRGFAPLASILTTSTLLLGAYGAGIWFLAPELVRDVRERFPLFSAMRRKAA